MWNIKGTSKLTQQRIEKENYKTHLKHLECIAPTMKILPHVKFLKDREKHKHNTRHQKNERQKMLDLLYDKIAILKPDKNLNHHVEKVEPKTRLIPDPQLQNQNKKLIGRLVRVTPSYSIDDMKKASQKHAQLSNKISQNARRRPTLSLKKLKRCKSAGTTVREAKTVDQNEVQQVTENITTSRSRIRPQSSFGLKRKKVEQKSTNENTNTIQSARFR